jgi:uncharacterized membrane protein YphA (DoxX/SURF4 family)
VGYKNNGFAKSWFCSLSDHLEVLKTVRRPSIINEETRTIADVSSLIYLMVRILLGAVFLGSGISKLMAPQNFSLIIESYGLISNFWILPTAIILAFLEVAAGLGLMLDIQGSLAVITALLGVFIAILSYGIWMGLDVDCGCFGPESREANAFHRLQPALVRDIIMVLGVLYLYFWRFRQNVTPRRLSNTVKRFKKEEN